MGFAKSGEASAVLKAGTSNGWHLPEVAMMPL